VRILRQLPIAIDLYGFFGVGFNSERLKMQASFRAATLRPEGQVPNLWRQAGRTRRSGLAKPAAKTFAELMHENHSFACRQPL
jgi:hypothetical protein